MGIKHAFVSTVEDEPAQTNRVRPSDWNAEHIIEDGTNFNKAYAIKSANYTITSDDYYIEVDTAGITITLLTAVGIAGREYHIDNSSDGAVTVDTTSSQTINGLLTQTVNPNNNMKVVSNGTNWRIK